MTFLEKLKKIRKKLSKQPGHILDEMLGATTFLEKPEEITEEERRILEGVTEKDIQLILKNKKTN